MSKNSRTLTVGLAQIAPVFLDRAATLRKVVARIREAAERGCGLVVFGEALVPGYPVWIERTDGARFDAPDQKAIFARYVQEAVQPEAGHLTEVCRAAREGGLTVVLGAIERAHDRGGHSLYCTRFVIDEQGRIASSHRKLMPTHEERLAWSIGDGAGLVVHPVGPFTLGALNCWENWMPLARAALYAQGENLHVAIWPGSRHNTADITRFIARESRSYVVSVSALLRAEDIPDDVPFRDMLRADGTIHDGGSAVANPDATWLLEPVTDRETLEVVELDHDRVLEERQNFDPSGHYARPDVLRLVVDRRRHQPVEWVADTDVSGGE